MDLGDEEDSLLDVFILEFEELMDIFKKSLKEIRKLNGDKKQAYQDIFRVFHTLKGDSGYFTEFGEFTKFATERCESLRYIDDETVNSGIMLNQLRIDYSRLSSALAALNKGNSMRAFRFKVFLKNY